MASEMSFGHDQRKNARLITEPLSARFTPPFVKSSSAEVIVSLSPFASTNPQ